MFDVYVGDCYWYKSVCVLLFVKIEMKMTFYVYCMCSFSPVVKYEKPIRLNNI